MKKFQFRLQPVLDFRADQLDLVKQKVAQEEQKRFALLARLNEYDQVIAQALQEQQDLLTQPGLNPMAAQMFPNYLWRLKQERAEQFQALQAQEAVLVAAREELRQAHLKVKTLELLKDKQQSRHRKHLEKQEEEFLAEIALNRSIRATR